MPGSPQRRYDPDGTRLPIKLDSTSNGEFCPIPLSQRNLAANERARDEATRNARRAGLNRRDFLVSGCGAFLEVPVARAELQGSPDVAIDIGGEEADSSSYPLVARRLR